MYPPYLPREGFTPPFVHPHGPKTAGFRLGGLVFFCKTVRPAPSSCPSPASLVPRHPIRMLINFGEFFNDFGSLLGRFFDLQTMLKLCLLTFYIAYTQSLISNTPYRVLKVFHLRDSVEIQ